MAFIHYIRQHKRKFVVVGAATVFFTYIVRDQFRDSAKDQVAAINKAKSAYSDKLFRDGEQLRLYSIEETLAFQREVHYKKHRETVSGFFREQDALQAQVQIENVIAAVDELKASMAHDDDVDQREAATLSAKEKLDTAEQVLFQRAVRVKDWENKFVTPDQEAAAVAVHKADDAASLELANLVLQVLADADAEKDRRQRRYRFFNWLNGVLYAVGWAIGLVGEFAKEERVPAPVQQREPTFDPMSS